MEKVETTFNLNQLVSEGAHVVDFWASWCGPCKVVAPVVDELKKKYEGKVGIHMVDVDENQDLAKEYGIKGIPCFIFFKDGKEITRVAGVKPIEFYEEKISQISAN